MIKVYKVLKHNCFYMSVRYEPTKPVNGLVDAGFLYCADKHKKYM